MLVLIAILACCTVAARCSTVMGHFGQVIDFVAARSCSTVCRTVQHGACKLLILLQHGCSEVPHGHPPPKGGVFGPQAQNTSLGGAGVRAGSVA